MREGRTPSTEQSARWLKKGHGVSAIYRFPGQPVWCVWAQLIREKRWQIFNSSPLLAMERGGRRRKNQQVMDDWWKWWLVRYNEQISHYCLFLSLFTFVSNIKNAWNKYLLIKLLNIEEYILAYDCRGDTATRKGERTRKRRKDLHMTRLRSAEVSLFKFSSFMGTEGREAERITAHALVLLFCRLM